MLDVVSAVLRHAAERPDAVAVQLFSKRSRPAIQTWREMAEAARRAAGFLHRTGVRRGDIVVLIGTHQIDLYGVWLGCVWLGAIPTILAEPSVRVNPEIYWSRLGELLRRINAWGLAYDPKVKIQRELLMVPQAHAYDAITAITVEADQASQPTPEPVRPAADDILLLQHSSGTTGLQKGVVLSHCAVWRHAESYNRVLQLSPADRIASWLPLYHDMGFIACFLNPLLSGVPVVWLSPFEWVANPALLLEAVTQHKATLTWLPNFAFQFLAQRVKHEPGRFDLSSLRAVVNCSEPVTAEVMHAFQERFAPEGLSPDALHTCYAMAENVFAVSSSHASCPPRERRIVRSVWHAEHRSVVSLDNAPNTITHVSNGRCVPDCELRIVDDEQQILPSGIAGMVQIRSPFLFSGYFGRDDLNPTIFDADGFYDTGDLGYLDEDGHVYITGRKKDLIIVGGRNIYPQDVEQLAGEVPGVYPGRAVCFGVSIRDLGTEGLVILVESNEPVEGWEEIARQVRVIVPNRLDLDVFDVRVQSHGTLRKSTSGKLARQGNREWYLTGRFGALPDAVVNDLASL